MNNKNNLSHLSEDELIVSLIDQKDLPPERYVHLSGCPACSSARKTIHQQLSGIGRKAERLAPLLSKKLYLPQAEDKQRYRRRRYLTPAFGGILAIILAVMAVWRPGALKTDKINPGGYIRSDDTLLIQVSALVENPLPDTYREISDIAESDMKEDVTDLIVPSLENSISRLKSRNTGLKDINSRRNIFYAA
jgi:hypothetical protein